MAVDSQVFPQSALDANRQGSLTDSQRKLIRTLSRGTRKSELTVAAFAAVFGIFLFFAVRPSTPALERLGIPIACLALAAFLLLRAITGEDRLTRDLRHPRVESLEGPISKHTVSTDSGNSSSTIHYLDVASQRFEVGRHGYQEAPDAGFVRIYFLSISRHVVNLERLPDRSLPQGTTPQALAHGFKDAMRSHDEAQLDELRAEMAGTVNALQAGISHDVAPPPEGSRDQRPLAEAIQGTWSNGPVTVTFTRNGTFTIMMLGANERSGHWSDNGGGKLMADFGGRSGPIEAWVAGEQLTVSFEGTAVTLKRVSD